MQHRITSVFSICILAFTFTSCVKQTLIAGRRPPATRPEYPATLSLSESIRLVLKVSGENTEANTAALERLHGENPTIAGLAQRVSSDPSDLAAMQQLADLYTEHGHYSDAFSLYQQLRLKAPQDAACELGLARIWDKWRNCSLALDHANRAIALDNGSSSALETRGLIHLHCNEIESAISSLVAAVELAPDNPVLLTNTGYAYLLKGEWKMAHDCLERALEIDGSMVEAHNNLGIALAYLEDAQGALNHFMAVNDTTAAHNNLGVIYLAQHRWKEAQSQFQTALSIDPGYVIALQNLGEAEVHLPPTPIYTIQFFSVKSEEAARAGVECFEKKSGITAGIQRADMKEEGVWYRARIYGFQTYSAALQVAKELILAGIIEEYWIVPMS